MAIQDVRSLLLKNSDTTLKYHTRKLSDIKQIVVHCDDSDWTYQQVNAYDISTQCHINPGKGCPGMTYTYFIMPDGTTYYCMDQTEVTWHVGMFNWESLGVCISYKAIGVTTSPPATQLDALVDLLGDLCLQLKVEPKKVVGHRELPGTGYLIINGKKQLKKTCPGMLVDLDNMRTDVAKDIQKKLAAKNLYNGSIDGVFGIKTRTGFLLFK
jgi:hypothetical protein